MKISVLVPTYRRPRDLRRCLLALRAQARPADEVIVVVRDGDAETRSALAGFDPGALPLKRVTVNVPGVVAAMTAGMDAADGDIVALTDDDAAPRPDWLTRIEAHFRADAWVGGVGGRDLVYHNGRLEEGDCRTVGQVQWFGRVIGNHHLGVGPARQVDVLKGVNCAYRTETLRQVGFESRLLGDGAQVHWELCLGLGIARRGWKMIYDPAILVDHHPAQRFDEDQRGGLHQEAHRRAVHNETLALMTHLPPWRRLVYAGYALAIGTRESPGFLHLFRLLASRDRDVLPRFSATLRGRAAGLRASFFRQSCEFRSEH
ncbi:MAG: glycosyltransferase [Armatimonadetes bacterium]|nr:glycosyltransferase [Armatimonadota bacterium]